MSNACGYLVTEKFPIPIAIKRMSSLHQIYSPDFLDEAELGLALGKTLPFSLNSQPEVHDFEQSEIFAKHWQVVCPAKLLENSGDRYICKLGGIPALIVRDNEGQLRGFVNACMHRAHPVAEKNGSSHLLTCRYHGWTYDLRGQLVRAPGAEQAVDCKKQEVSLLPLSVTEFCGCVFANADPDAPELLEALPELGLAVSKAAFDLSSYELKESIQLEISSNWKLIYDNVVECYHCPSMHATSLNTLLESNGFLDINWNGSVRHVDAALKDSKGTHNCIQLFPGSYLVQDPVVGIVGRFYPISAGQSILEFHFLAAPGASKEDTEHFIKIWRHTLAEDAAIVEAQQTIISSGRIAQGRLIDGPETSVIGVQQLILQAYRQAHLNRQDQGGRDAIIA
jgi:phenylpropionate dioxygenase-like ring-hydroxylating dioxygenase large terminal subunit